MKKGGRFMDEVDVTSRRYDCGWNIPDEIRGKILQILKRWEPRGDRERRDKRICELAFAEDMNAAQIERLKDPLLVRYTANGKRLDAYPLTSKGIREIIYRRFPDIRRKRGYSVVGAAKKKRAELAKDFYTLTANKPKICAVCGSVEELRLHHIVPVSHGGTNDNVNLIFLCDSCHKDLHMRIYKSWGGHTVKENPKEEKPAAAVELKATFIKKDRGRGRKVTVTPRAKRKKRKCTRKKGGAWEKTVSSILGKYEK